MSNNNSIYWFTNDLRIHDNSLLLHAATHSDSLICVYCYPLVNAFHRKFAQENQFGQPKTQFLNESLNCLNISLTTLQQRLLIATSPPYKTLKHLINKQHIDVLYTNVDTGSYESNVIDKLRIDFRQLRVIQHDTQSLFFRSQLPFELEMLPKTFTQFHKQMTSITVPAPIESITCFPTLPTNFSFPSEHVMQLSKCDHHAIKALFHGGEKAGLKHCNHYFSTNLPSHYKETRNGLDGKNYSTKFSPWLAHGCLSSRTIYAFLKQYESINGGNSSTYWIYFELLWREYFHWSARLHQNRLFSFDGIANKTPLTSFYPQRFQQWKNGSTPFPIVNACMHQLKETGYMSNRGRQLVASCFVHELEMDWRYGSSYFETQLIDYDMASNWGNWQNIAGVGAHVGGSRPFNIEEQTKFYDPNSEFITTWRGHCAEAKLNNVDMVDWPIS